MDSIALLAGLCQKAHLERGKKYIYTSILWLAEIFLDISSRKKKLLTDYQCKTETQVAQINREKNTNRTAASQVLPLKDEIKDTVTQIALKVFPDFKSPTGTDPNPRK